MADKLEKSDADWKSQLSEAQYQVTRRAGTEAAFTGEYWDHKEAGRYLCACCSAELFRSDTKFDSGTGWPSFWQPSDPGAVDTKVDDTARCRESQVPTKSRLDEGTSAVRRGFGHRRPRRGIASQHARHLFADRHPGRPA